MDIDNFIGSTEKQVNGVWVRYNDTDTEFLVAYKDAPSSRKYTANAFAKNRRKVKRGFLPPEIVQEITLETILRHLLKDWRGLTIKNAEGETVDFPYTPTNARQFLTKSVVARDFIAEESADPDNYDIVISSNDEGDDERPEGESEVSAVDAELKSGAPLDA